MRFVTRESYGLGTQKTADITLYDLVRTSLRYKPDYLIVGEVRGRGSLRPIPGDCNRPRRPLNDPRGEYRVGRQEAYKPPMNIPPSHIPLIDAVALVERVSFTRPVDGKTYGRRIRYIWEIVDFGKYVTIVEWNPATDPLQHRPIQ